MWMRVCVLVVVLSSCFSRADAEAVTCAVAPNYMFYEVNGSSADELEESLRLQGPRDELGARRFAYTDWTVKWEWKRFEDGSVDPLSVSLSCLATILLPRVGDVEALSPELSGLWSAFIKRTRQHELRHVSHVEQTASQIVKRIRDEHQRMGMVSVKHAKAIVRNVMAEIKAMDRRYDAETDHGRTEGTWKIAQ